MTIKVFVEIPKGSGNKYERDEKTGELFLDRVLYGPVRFPFEYGYVQGTMGEDGDPLDVVLFATYPTFPGCVVEANVIGYLQMEDESGIDHKVLAVPTPKKDPRWAHIQDISDLSEHDRAEVKEFFEVMKRLEPGKWVKVQDYKSAKEAQDIIEAGFTRAKNV